MSVGLGALLDKTIQAHEEGRRGPVPARVEAFDAEEQTCDAKPLVRPFISGQAEELPVARCVPVLFPRGGGFSITWPLEVGDIVYLIPSEGDISRWHASGKEDEPAATRRRADLSDAVALPGPSSLIAALDSEAFAEGALVVAGDDIRLGSSSASSFLALATLVDAALEKIAKWGLLVEDAIPTGSVIPPLAQLGSFDSVAATKVKGE